MAGRGNYGDDLGRRFAVQYGDWRSNNRSPQSRDEHYAYLNNSQTHRCARLAAHFYHENHGVRLTQLDPLDSQAFSCSWTSLDDNRRCFHATFKANAGTHGRQFFFAELLGNGNGPPQEVRHCVMLGAWSTNNCVPCSGMWHPKESGSFDFGRK